MTYANAKRQVAAPPLPRNAAWLLQAGLEPGGQLIVSFVGETQFSAPHVYADSGRRYDWTFAAGSVVAIVVKPGIDASHAIDSIFRGCNAMLSYPQLVDIERRQIAYVVDGPDGKVKLLRVKEGAALWLQYFG